MPDMKAPRLESPCFPDWLESFRLPDDLSQQAYEKFGAQARSLIKTAIALAHFHFSPAQGISCNSESNPVLAFNAQTASWPANSAYIIFSQNYDAAALACAAAILPQLCALPNIHAYCLCERPSFAILATLELCGIEDIFCLEPEKCLELLKSLSLPASINKNINPARALLLDFDGSLRHLASILDNYLPILYLNKRPLVCLENPSSWDDGMLRLLFGSQARLGQDPSLCDAFYMDSPSLLQEDLAVNAPLILSKACAAFWIFPELRPDFFQMRKLCFDLFNPLI